MIEYVLFTLIVGLLGIFFGMLIESAIENRRSDCSEEQEALEEPEVIEINYDDCTDYFKQF